MEASKDLCRSCSRTVMPRVLTSRVRACYMPTVATLREILFIGGWRRQRLLGSIINAYELPGIPRHGGLRNRWNGVQNSGRPRHTNMDPSAGLEEGSPLG
jgi:hypothetical protein